MMDDALKIGFFRVRAIMAGREGIICKEYLSGVFERIYAMIFNTIGERGQVDAAEIFKA